MSSWWSLCTLSLSHAKWSYRRWLRSPLLWACVQLFERNYFPLFVGTIALLKQRVLLDWDWELTPSCWKNSRPALHPPDKVAQGRSEHDAARRPAGGDKRGGQHIGRDPHGRGTAVMATDRAHRRHRAAHDVGVPVAMLETLQVWPGGEGRVGWRLHGVSVPLLEIESLCALIERSFPWSSGGM